MKLKAVTLLMIGVIVGMLISKVSKFLDLDVSVDKMANAKKVEYESHDQTRKPPLHSINIANSNIESKRNYSKAWHFPGLFHFTNDGHTIEGPVVARFKVRNGLFDLTQESLWTQVQSKHCGMTVEKYIPGCSWCSSRNPSICRNDGTLTVARMQDSHTRVHKTTVQLIQSRSYSRPEDTYHPQYRVFSLRCDFASRVIEAEDSEGVIRLIGAESFSARTNILLRNSESENVVCSRALFGNVDPISLLRFTKYYLERWKFSKVIFYEVGLDYMVQDASVHSVDDKTHKELRELIASDSLIIVDVRDELQRLYGPQFWDVAVLTATVMQMPLKNDCIARSKALGVRWSVHLDLDELLFESLHAPGIGPSLSPDLPWRCDSFDKFLDLHGLADDLWVSFSVVTANTSEPCRCGDGSYDTLEFVKAGNIIHRKELEDLPGYPGPFIYSRGSMNAQYGKRKYALRLDKSEVHTFALGIHKIHPYCGFGNVTASLGHNLDPWKHLYIREYDCLNSNICVTRNYRGNYQWFD
jgi:hypothetical protein